MSTPDAAVFGTQTPQVEGDDYNTLVFAVQQILAKVNTCSIVQVMACTNAGGIVPAGTVDVQPLINQMTGARVAVPHGIISKLPYSRMQGGNSAIILDPQPGDIGVVVFSQRDITHVVNSRARANPGSFRQFNWADGIYIGGILNLTPNQYVVFTPSGISIVSPTLVTVQAPTVNVQASSSATVNAPVVNIEGGGTVIDGKPYLPHTHISASPGSPTGPVI